MFKRISFIVLIGFGILTCSFAQTIEIKSVQLQGELLTVNYDLLDSVEGRSYSIRMYSSYDGFLSPLEKVTGDIGLEVKTGKNKTISWQVLNELPASFGGKIAVEIRARIFVPFIITNAINQYKVFKRKRKYNITWSGGTPQNVLNFDLYHDDKKIHTFPNLANVGHYSLEFPVHIKPGRYKFRISDAKNKDEVVYTTEFKIKRKYPLLLKVLPVAVIGTGIYYLVTRDTDDGLPGPTDLPDRGTN